MKISKSVNQNDVFHVINIRKEVFILEQNVPIELELDDYDYTANHYLIEDNSNIIGTARYYIENEVAVIGRVAILKEYRKLGYASKLLLHLIDDIKNTGIKTIELGAQEQALKFYEKLGFKISGEIYLDANIEHYPMKLILS